MPIDATTCARLIADIYDVALEGRRLDRVLGAFARLARQYPDLTSPDDYIRPSLGRDMGFLATTAYWLSSWVGNNAIAVAAVGYLVILLPVGDSAGVQLAGQVLLAADAGRSVRQRVAALAACEQVLHGLQRSLGPDTRNNGACATSATGCRSASGS